MWATFGSPRLAVAYRAYQVWLPFMSGIDGRKDGANAISLALPRLTTTSSRVA